MRRRITVQFGSTRVAVPCGDGRTTLREIAEAAATRYKNARGEGGEVRVHQLRLPEDEAILDMHDTVDDVLDEGATHILAIYDEDELRGARVPPAHGVSPYSPASASPSTHHNSNGRTPPTRISRSSVVEVADPDALPLDGLRVSSSRMPPPLPLHSPQHSYSASLASTSAGTSTTGATPVVRSSLRSEGVTSPTRAQRVTLSPEVTKKLDLAERSGSGRIQESRLGRTMTRKSKMSESFYDAKERLEEDYGQHVPASHSMPSHLSSVLSSPATSTASPIPLSAAHSRTDSANSGSFVCPAGEGREDQTLLVLHDTRITPIGIEVIGVLDESDSRRGKLSSLQIVAIDEDGRVGRDGRLRTGDSILELEGRPVYQMSLIRARSFLLEMGTKASTTLTIGRPLSTFDGSPPSSSLDRDGLQSSGKRAGPIQSALQQANTAELQGETHHVSIPKRKDGFGFTVTGRETAAGRRLFYIGTVKSGGAAIGVLHGGDRLLQVNESSTEDLTQAEVVDRLKKVPEGGEVRLVISRVGGPAIPPATTDKERNKENNRPEPMVEAGWEELLLSIPLNNTGSAGLGVSLKARVTVKNDQSRHDCGIFVKKVLVGGAAFKDGRLRVDDRLVAIEDVDLRRMESNADASFAITGKLKQIGQNAAEVTLKIWRPLSGASSSSSSSLRSAPTCRGDGDVSPLYNGASPASRTTAHMRTVSTLSESGHGTVSSECSNGEESEDKAGVDPFSRDTPARKSMSEKRGMGASSDATQTTTFQKIKHGRETSAPPPSASFHGASAVAKRTAERIRSQSVHPRVPVEDEEEERRNDPPIHRVPSNSLPRPIRAATMQPGERREEGGEDGRKTVTRGNPVKHSFRQAMDDTAVNGNANSPWVYQSMTDSPIVARRGNGTGGGSTHREKEKERRKSMGSNLLSFFKLGKSRDGSPEKTQGEAASLQRRREEEQRRRQEVHSMHVGHTTPTSMRRRPVFSEYVPAGYPQDPSSPPPLIVANSKFYASFSARDPRTPPSWIGTSATVGSVAVPPNSPWESLPSPPPSPLRPLPLHPPPDPPTTTVPSMRGSHTLAAIPPQYGHAPAPPPSTTGSRPITAFHTTRFPVYPAIGTAPRASKERLSLRARKKLRETRDIPIERTPTMPSPIPAPPPGVAIPVIRMRREDPGGSLPSRHYVHPITRPPLNHDAYAQTWKVGGERREERRLRLLVNGTQSVLIFQKVRQVWESRHPFPSRGAAVSSARGGYFSLFE